MIRKGLPSVFIDRRFLALALPITLLGLASACATRPESAPRRFEFTRAEMGMEFRIVLYAPTPGHASAAATAAFDRIHALNAIFSDYEEDSELTQLSRSAGQGHAVPLSAELWDVLTRAQALSVRTGGAFDVTVGPHVTLWRRARRQREPPRADLLERARQAVGHDKLVLDPKGRTATLKAPRMRLDLGGIAKGYAMDAALRVLNERGIRSALVSGGGDMVLGDPPPGKRRWRIALAPLDAPDAPPVDHLEIARCALATSGDSFQHVVIEGKRYSHIVDPRTGEALTDHSLVRVVAPDSTTADSLATAISVLGPEQGLELAGKYRGVEVRIVRRPGEEVEIHQSQGFQELLSRDPTAVEGSPGPR